MEASTTRASGDTLPASGCAARHQSVPGSERWGWLKCKETGAVVYLFEYASLHNFQSQPAQKFARMNVNECKMELKRVAH